MGRGRANGRGRRGAWTLAIALILLSCQSDAAARDIPDPNPAERCANGIAVPNPESNPALVLDCAILLRILDSMPQSEAARPAWDADIPLSRWEEISLGGAPTRVIGAAIRERWGRYREHEPPRILPALARLDGLRKLVIEGDFARGAIPAEIGKLSNLEELVIDGAPQRDYMSSHPPRRPKLPPPKGALGPMPPELGNLGGLKTLIIRRASLKGTMPRELGNLARLERLELGDRKSVV